eukprot:2291710-Amphidinium_carterae.2
MTILLCPYSRPNCASGTSSVEQAASSGNRGDATFPNKVTGESSWSTGDLRKIIDHCPLGKARGVDRWSIGELSLLPDIAINDLATLLNVEIIGVWPRDIREMMYLQLPKHDVTLKQWRARCTGRGEVLVGRGALDGTFELALETELTTAARGPQAGLFLDCSKCYERMPLRSKVAIRLMPFTLHWTCMLADVEFSF